MTVTDPALNPEGPKGDPGAALTNRGRRYLNAAGVNTGYSTPWNAAFNPSSTQLMRFEAWIIPSAWPGASDQSLIALFDTGSNHRGYRWTLSSQANKVLGLSISPNGSTPLTTLTSTRFDQALAAAVNELPYRVRSDYLPNDGTGHYTFSNWLGTYVDGTLVWQQIGSTQTGVSVVPFASPSALFVGQDSNGATPYTGRLYEASLAVAGTIVADLDVRGASDPPATYTGAAGRVWTPLASAVLLPDEVSDFDMRNKTFSIGRLLPPTDPTKKFAMAVGGAAVWSDGAGSITSASLDMKDIMAHLLGWHNVLDYGAPMNGVSDDTPGFQAAHDAIAQTNPVSGGTIYIPSPCEAHPLRRALLKTPIISNFANLRIVGGGAAGGQLRNARPGPTWIQVQQQFLRFNEGVGGNNFSGPSFSDMYISPSFCRLSAAQIISAVVTASAGYPLTSFPASGACMLWDETHGLARFTYTSIVGQTFQGCVVTYEQNAGSTYATGSIITLAGTAGIGPVVSSNIIMERMTIGGFLDNQAGDRIAGYCYWLDGATAGISQYNKFHNCWFNEYHIGGIEDTSSSRHLASHFDMTNSGTFLPPGSRCLLGTDVRTMALDDCEMVGAEILLDLSGAGGTGNTGVSITNLRAERWTQRAILLKALKNAYISGGSTSNNVMSAIGTYLECGSLGSGTDPGVENIHIEMPSVSQVADYFVIDANTTGVFRIQNTGSPVDVYAAPKGSHYTQINGVALVDGGTGIEWIKKSLGTAPYKHDWIAVA